MRYSRQPITFVASLRTALDVVLKSSDTFRLTNDRDQVFTGSFVDGLRGEIFVADTDVDVDAQFLMTIERQNADGTFELIWQYDEMEVAA